MGEDDINIGVLLGVRKLSGAGYGLQKANKLTCPGILDTKHQMCFWWMQFFLLACRSSLELPTLKD